MAVPVPGAAVSMPVLVFTLTLGSIMGVRLGLGASMGGRCKGRTRCAGAPRGPPGAEASLGVENKFSGT